MKKGAFISICIPAYKRPENISRLLYSISIQSYKDYEIIITDDSPDNSLEAVLQKYNFLPITYHRNMPALGTPANWNMAISLAKGEWIKIMHDDDWFSSEQSLEIFSLHTDTEKKFIFSAYTNVWEQNDKQRVVFFPVTSEKKLIKNPMKLLPRNVIGPPSVTLIHKSIGQEYDSRMKWRVDIDFYVSVLKQERAMEYINQPLVNVGVSGTQVTNFCINIPEVELPEGLLLLQKHGINPLKNIWVYDAWWRIIRNVDVRSKSDLDKFTPGSSWPEVILKMIRHESKIPRRLLKFGVFSKLAMVCSYILNRNIIKN